MFFSALQQCLQNTPVAPSTAIAAQGYAAHASNGGIEAVDELPAAIRTQPLELDKLCTV